jgi:tetratricopeptide (TPR) repeat protein
MTRVAAYLGSACLAACWLVQTELRAEPSARDRAAAEAIFQQASALMDEKKFSEACEKFAASQELDPGLGTLLYLADCYDQAGRTASAWALFREVEDRSKRADQPDRQRIAGERATALEGRLSKLEIRVPSARSIEGLELLVGGSLIPSASWNVPLPVDPGATKIEARAPGKKPVMLQISVTKGPSSQVVELPALVDAPRAAAKNRAARDLGREPAPPSTTQRTIGYVLGGLGLVGLGVGGYFGYRAYKQNDDSKAQCLTDDPNACTQDGVDLRRRARTSANVATIATVSGAALTVGALTVIVTAPSPNKELAGWQMRLRGEF